MRLDRQQSAPAARRARATVLGAVLSVFLAPALSSTPAFAADPSATASAVEAARTKVHQNVAAWESARQKQSETRGRADALEHRITQLKRKNAGGDELERLLKESVTAGDALRRDDQAVAARAADVKSSVLAATALVDQRIKELLPRLKQGAIADKKAAARAINELRAVRKELGSFALRLSEPSAMPKTWAKYEVKIDPLDGPAELSEKADLVEDTRERFRKKREELARLMREARVEQEVSRASAEFRTDVGIFDEETRVGRVTRQDRTLAVAAADKAPAPEASRGATGGSEAPGNGFTAGTQQPPPATPGTSDSASESRDPGSLGTQPTTGTPGSSGTSGQVARATEVAPLKQIDPNALLNLRTEALEGRAIDLATLEALVSDLDRLDQFLAGRAGELRGRAKQLKEDEARALSKP